MRNKWAVVGIAVSALVALGIFAGRQLADQQPNGAAPGDVAASRAPLRASALRDKPVCPPNASPLRADCVPAHLANLPPDPGPAGMATVQGIDSNGDGIRDDIEIFIAENYGYSARAVYALRTIAKLQQQLIIEPGSSPADALSKGHSLTRAIACYVKTVDEGTRNQNPGAMADVITELINTPERHRQYLRHEQLLAGQAEEMPDPRLSVAELCGYDPEALPN